MRTTQKREMQSVAEKRGERGNPEGERAHTRKRGAKRTTSEKWGHGAGCMECRDARRQRTKRRDSGGYAEARAWRECGSVAEEEQKMHGRAMGGSCLFRKAEGKAISE